LIPRENEGYYSRPMLSRGFTKADIEQTIVLKSFEKIRESGIAVISDADVYDINSASKSLSFNRQGQSQTLAYDKLIIATGSAAFIPPPYLPYKDLFFSLNSLTDLKQLRSFRQNVQQQNSAPHWAIIGGGLIGCEVASDLAVAGDKVTLFHAMDRLMERQLDVEDSARLLDVLQTAGIEVRFNQAIKSLGKQDHHVCVNTDSAYEFDGLIVSCGFKPRTGLAEMAGLTIGRGIKVNEYLQSSDDAIYALGDVAELPNGKLYAFILPIRSQALWLAGFLNGQLQESWTVPVFTPKAKVHGFEALHPPAF
ncbi:MAG: FAD-dependent oxidoreductase, partial [Methylicorpusculum sp.]|nr:FAD-dependent oxidoreductase [Methylicorpusculum sp.]